LASWIKIEDPTIKTTLRFYLNPVRIGTIKSTTNNKCWQGCRGKGILIHYRWGYKLTQLLWKTIWRLLKKLKIDLPCNPAIPLLGTYLKGCESSYNKGTCTPMFIAALFTIAKLRKQPRCPLLMNGLRKCGIYTQWNFIRPQRMKFCHS
jgi:hypothetical protein